MELSSFNIFSALIAAAIVLHYTKPTLGDDIGTNFFLKASKSVPRIGRRSMMDYENYFLKASKSVPRIGRRRTLSPIRDAGFPFHAFKSYPGIDKRSFAEKYFTETGQPIWSTIEKAYEEYPGMFHSDEPYRETSIDSNPDLYWQRMKKEPEEEETRSQAEV